jgi:transcriptional regulator with XRE-family HTH domain
VAVALAEARSTNRKTDESVRLGVELERIRRDRGLTQLELAERLGMSVEGYRNYAKGYGRVTRDKLPRWARALEMPIPELARRLGISLLTEPDASGLRQELVTLLPEATADGAERLVRDLAELAPNEQRQVLDTVRRFRQLSPSSQGFQYFGSKLANETHSHVLTDPASEASTSSAHRGRGRTSCTPASGRSSRDGVQQGSR